MFTTGFAPVGVSILAAVWRCAALSVTGALSLCLSLPVLALLRQRSVNRWRVRMIALQENLITRQAQRFAIKDNNL